MKTIQTLPSNATKILVLGSSGMLGWDFVRVLKQSGFLVVNPSHTELDVTDEKRVTSYIQKHRPLWVINCVAYTAVDKAEVEKESAYLLNVSAPSLLANACYKFDCRLIHFSTDQVFDGQKNKAYHEEDIANPLNYYSSTKLQGEKPVLEAHGLVLRVQWLYGEKKERFSKLKNLNTFTPFVDQWGAPTWTYDIVSSVISLISKNSKGLFHFSYDDYTNWYEVFCFIKKYWNLKIELIPKKLTDVKLEAKRPSFCVMSNSKLKKELDISSLGLWRSRLEEFLGTLC